MTEETKAPVEEPKDPVGGGEQTEEESSSGRTFTEAEMRAEAEKLAAKRSEAAERKRIKAEKDLETFRKARETEDEKAERERKEREEARIGEIRTEAEKRAELLGVLVAKGKSMDQAKKLADFLGNDWTDTESAIKTLSDSLGVTFGKTITETGGGGGNPPKSDDEIEYTPEFVTQRMRQPDGPEWYKQHRDKIKAWQQRKLGGVRML